MVKKWKLALVALATLGLSLLPAGVVPGTGVQSAFADTTDNKVNISTISGVNFVNSNNIEDKGNKGYQIEFTGDYLNDDISSLALSEDNIYDLDGVTFKWVKVSSGGVVSKAYNLGTLKGNVTGLTSGDEYRLYAKVKNNSRFANTDASETYGVEIASLTVVKSTKTPKLYVDDDTWEFTGGQIKPSFSVELNGNEVMTYKNAKSSVTGSDVKYYRYDDENAEWETNYTDDNELEEAGKYKAVLDNCVFADYDEEVSTEFTIRCDISTYGKIKVNNSTKDATLLYNYGKNVVFVNENTGNSTVGLAYGKGTATTYDADADGFKVSYENNVNVGTAKIIVTGNGYWYGTVEKEFEIKPVKLANANLSVKAIAKQAYAHGEEIKPTGLVVTGGDDGKYTLVEGTDYTLEYKNNIKVGTATITLVGAGNFVEGSTYPAEFEIVEGQIGKDATVATITAQAYTGEEIKPVKVVQTVNGKEITLTEGTDYTVKYENNTEPGEAKYTVTGTGN